MAIVFYRIDERAVHGQTVVSWSKVYPNDGIILVSDYIANNKILREIYSKATFDTKVHIFDTETALTKLIEAENSKRKYMVIVQEPITLWKIIKEKAIKPEKINVGPMTKRDGRRSVSMGVYMDDAEIEACKNIIEQDISIEFQLLPGKEVRKFEDLKI